MLHISRVQMDALQKASLARFQRDMLRHLQVRFAHLAAVGDERWLRQQIELGIRDADLLKIRDETDVRRYLEYAIAFGLNWYRDANRGDVGMVITDLSIGATSRMNHADLLMARKQGEAPDAQLSSSN